MPDFVHDPVDAYYESLVIYAEDARFNRGIANFNRTYPGCVIEFGDLLNKTGDFVVEIGEFFNNYPGRANEFDDFLNETDDFV